MTVRGPIYGVLNVDRCRRCAFARSGPCNFDGRLHSDSKRGWNKLYDFSEREEGEVEPPKPSLLRPRTLRVRDGGADHRWLAVAHHRQLGRIAHPKQTKAAAQLGGVPHRRSGKVCHDIASLEASEVSRRSRIDFGDDRCGRGRGEFELAHQGRSGIIEGDPELSPADIARFEDMIHDGTDHVDGNRKADAGIGVARAHERGVDADQIAAEIDKRAAGMAWIEGGIGLDEILVLLDADVGAVQSADYPGSHGLADLEWIADGEHEVADLDLVGIADGNSGEVLGGNLDDRNDGIRISRDQLSGQFPSIGESNGNFFGMLYDVIVGDNEALARVCDDARSGGACLLVNCRRFGVPRPALLGIAIRPPALDGDADHSGSDFLENGRERRNSARLLGDRKRHAAMGRNKCARRERESQRASPEYVLHSANPLWADKRKLEDGTNFEKSKVATSGLKLNLIAWRAM